MFPAGSKLCSTSERSPASQRVAAGDRPAVALFLVIISQSSSESVHGLGEKALGLFVPSDGSDPSGAIAVAVAAVVAGFPHSSSLSASNGLTLCGWLQGGVHLCGDLLGKGMLSMTFLTKAEIGDSSPGVFDEDCPRSGASQDEEEGEVGVKIWCDPLGIPFAFWLSPFLARGGLGRRVGRVEADGAAVVLLPLLVATDAVVVIKVAERRECWPRWRNAGRAGFPASKFRRAGFEESDVVVVGVVELRPLLLLLLPWPCRDVVGVWPAGMTVVQFPLGVPKSSLAWWLRVVV
mmetsp:Transcript_67766/g.147658  ORF Transcript_67766/g.147658 Transcript_67766/m.147658 type:complete len:292 (+) Transcript_67766:160-1035(+)